MKRRDGNFDGYLYLICHYCIGVLSFGVSRLWGRILETCFTNLVNQVRSSQIKLKSGSMWFYLRSSDLTPQYLKFASNTSS